MISQREIEHISEKLKVSKNTIDKDWALGHFIDAIYSLRELKDVLIFKGGTCLKKCYLPDYRFSEDIDFTAADEKFALTNSLLKKVINLVNKRSGVACHIVSLRDLIFKNRRTGYEAIIKYWGADHAKNTDLPAPERWQTAIKIEIILYELMCFSPKKKKVIHLYSDALSKNASKISCYPIEEIMAEKIRALIQRKYTAPRDYYDIWYLSNKYKQLNNNKIVSAFKEKVKYKNLEFTGIKQLITPRHEKILRHSWHNSLAHQIPQGKLPDYTTVVPQVKAYFKSIFKEK